MPNFGQNYIQANSSLPSDSFGFRNGVTASAIIALPIVGDSQPVSPGMFLSTGRVTSEWYRKNSNEVAVYISQFLNPPGYVKIRPIPKAQFWFQNIEARTMIPETQNNAYIVDLSGGSSATISYNSSGGGWTRLNWMTYLHNICTLKCSFISPVLLNAKLFTWLSLGAAGESANVRWSLKENL